MKLLYRELLGFVHFRVFWVKNKKKSFNQNMIQHWFFFVQVLLSFQHLNSVNVLSARRKKFIHLESDIAYPGPISAEPPLARPNNTGCKIELFQNITFRHFGDLYSQNFSLPTDCRYPWSKVILDVHGSVKGVQFDRYGAIWINEIEVLRTTTPEPNAAGINWQIEKDISLYADYYLSEFLSNGNLTAFISIPSNVGPVYTGIIYVDVSITFYQSNLEFPADNKNSPLVIPLTRAPQNNLFNSMHLNSNQSFSYPFSLPSSSMNARSLIADVYLSPHGCEEFYFSNLPTANASEFGSCGGGSYRELQIYIDETIFAGSIIPFPVIYTGGANPLLWISLTGIMSFDIPSYQIDLSPFLNLLVNTTVNHTIRFTVLNNNPQGNWFLDAALLVMRGEEKYVSLVPNKKPITVNMKNEMIEDSGMIIENNHVFPLIYFLANNSRSYQISSDLTYSNGERIRRIVRSQSTTQNRNSFPNENTMITQQTIMETKESITIYSDRRMEKQTTVSYYPFSMNDYYAEDATTMELAANINYSYHKNICWKSYPPPLFGKPTTTTTAIAQPIIVYEMNWFNQMSSNALYNRSLDHKTGYKYRNSAKETFLIRSKYSLAPSSMGRNESWTSLSLKKSPLAQEPATNNSNYRVCYHQNYQTNGGTVTGRSVQSKVNDSCLYPHRISFCKYGLCQLADFLPLH
jgi:hypothetical protein